MNKISKVIITFIISFVIAYLIVGYVIHGMFVGIKWVEDITIWGKLREYYIRTASVNIIPTFIIAIMSTGIISIINGKRC